MVGNRHPLKAAKPGQTTRGEAEFESSRFLVRLKGGTTKKGTIYGFKHGTRRFCSKAGRRCIVFGGARFSYEQLNPLADGLPADGAGLERGAALDAGGVSALEDQFDVVVDADGAGDPLLHLTVSRLQLLQQVVLLRVLRAWAAVHLRLVCEGREGL